MSITLKSVLSACSLLLLGCLTGCGDRGAIVSGSATFDGQPIENGQITFHPVDGMGPPTAGPIKGGKFKVEKIQPGAKVVEIIGVKEVSFGRSREEEAKLHSAASAQGNTTGIIERADFIPANAEGNNTHVELKAGSQELNFTLKKPKA